MSKVAIYPGTFDPITFGHIDVIKKSLKLFEKIIVAVSDGENKNYLFNINERIEYKITQGSPIKNHLGVLIFSEKKGKTHLNYTIQLESKIPLTTALIKIVLGTGIKRGLKRYARTL